MTIVNDPKRPAKTPSEPPPSGVAALAPADLPDIPPLAIRCDGRILLSTADLKGIDLAGRERWECIVITEAEASDIFDRLPFEEAAAPTVARILAQAKKPKKSPSDEEPLA